MKKQQLIMLMAVLFWAGAFVAGKYTANNIDPVTVTFLRFLIASVVLGTYIIVKRIRWEITWVLVRHSLILAVIGMIGYHLFFYKALEMTTATNASLIAATNPFFTYILSIIALGTAMKGRKFFFILMAMTGVGLIIVDWRLSTLIEGGVNPGDLIMFIGVFAWATYSILVKRFVNRHNPMILTATLFVTTTVLLAPFADYGLVSGLFDFPIEVVVSVFYMGIFPTVFGYMIQQYSIRSIGPERTNIFINLVPVFTVILSVLLLGERLHGLDLVAGAIVITGVYLFNNYK